MVFQQQKELMLHGNLISEIMILDALQCQTLMVICILLEVAQNQTQCRIVQLIVLLNGMGLNGMFTVNKISRRLKSLPKVICVSQVLFNYLTVNLLPKRFMTSHNLVCFFEVLPSCAIT